MNVCTWFLLFGTFAYLNSSPVSTSTEDERGESLALKCLLEINVKGTDNTVTGHKKNRLPNPTVQTFTDFIHEIVVVLNTFNDELFEDFFNILDKQIRKYHYRGCKFFELEGKHEFRSVLAEKLDWLTRKSVSEKRSVINETVNMIKLRNTYDRNIQKLLGYINCLFEDDSKKKFRHYLTDLQGFSDGYSKTRTRNDFVKLIRECIRATVFIHADLNINIRRELRKLFVKTIKKISSTNSTNRIFKAVTVEAALETSKADENNRQQDKITNSTTILMFYMTTKKPVIFFESERKSKLVERMLEEESAKRITIGQSTTTKRLRLSRKSNLKSSPAVMSDVENYMEIIELSNSAYA